jgi:hypothetical protein
VSPSAWRRRSGDVPAPARTNTVKAAVVNGWDVWPTVGLIVCLLERPTRLFRAKRIFSVRRANRVSNHFPVPLELGPVRAPGFILRVPVSFPVPCLSDVGSTEEPDACRAGVITKTNVVNLTIQVSRRFLGKQGKGHAPPAADRPTPHPESPRRDIRLDPRRRQRTTGSAEDTSQGAC